MILRGVRLQNYRSFRDSGWIEIGERLTIFIGKNGSGKSSILEALSGNAGQSWSIPTSASPVLSDKPSQITLRYELTAEEIDEAGERIAVEWTVDDKDALKSGILITRTSDTLDVDVAGTKNFTKGLLQRSTDARESALHSVFDSLASLQKQAPAAASIALPKNPTWMKVNAAYRDANDLLQSQITPSIRLALNQLNEASHRYYAAHTNMQFRDHIAKIAPTFVRLSISELPSQVRVPLAKVADSRFFSNFCSAVGLDPTSFSGLTPIQRRNRSEQMSRRMTELVRKLWTQDDIEFFVDCGEEGITIAVKLNDAYFEYEQLSTGTSWFIDAFAQIAAAQVRAASQPVILLLDEPAQHLHPTAQREVAHWLAEVAERVQLLYSTHSPYMFQFSKLHEIRPIVKSGGQSKVENSIFCTNDAETLSPLLDVIGLPLAESQGLRIAQQRNVLCEGPSDFFYLSAMSRLLNMTLDYSLIPCVGATRTQHIASILRGWALEFAVVVDNDKEGKGVKRAMDRYGSERVVVVSNTDGDAIEDLFTPGDFDRFVLPAIVKTGAARVTKNSIYVNQIPGGKKAIARSFAERSDAGFKGKFSVGTRKNFTALFSAIQRSFDRD